MNFETMFHNIYGYDPFPWQSEAANILMKGTSDLAVNVPTASGKTGLIDAAVYSATYGGPRRIVFIIDRRVVVDEAYRRAKRIEAALIKPDLEELAARLGPIQVVRLRGGVYGDDDWVLYPERVTIILSTVDQVGSRLLHRGYGVSPRMAPMHAGFVGNDCTYIIDEAHLSVPFVETVDTTRQYGANINLVTMTATPVSDSETIITLSEKDRNNPLLQKRLKAKKKVQLSMVKKAEGTFVKEAVTSAIELGRSAKVIGVVVNRVATARSIWQSIVKKKYHAVLLTGRVRPYDRDKVMDNLFPEIKAGRSRRGRKKNLFIIATQTIEVGADIDLDALVTEAAPLDSLRQRFGRVDRLGTLKNSQGIILYREPKRNRTGMSEPDPIYGDDIHRTWEWLEKVARKGQVDFGIDALEKVMKRRDPPKAELKHAPSLLPTHIGLLCQTGTQAPFVDVSSWLHGTGRASADVSIVWRADLTPDNVDQWSDIISLCPPLTREGLEIPIWSARSLLTGRKPPDVTDLEGIELSFSGSTVFQRPVLCWRGPDDSLMKEPNQVIPGDTVIVPSSYGGCDQYGWNPSSESSVTDIADYCYLERGHRHIVRLVPDLTDWLKDNKPIIKEAVDEVRSAEIDIDPEFGVDQDRIRQAHDSLRSLVKDIKHPLLEAFHGRFQIEMHPTGLVLRSMAIDEIRGTLNGGVAVELSEHLSGVAKRVNVIADKHNKHEKVMRAAELHDIGKQESRFQVMLHGDRFSAAAGPVLAKSGFRKYAEKRAAYIQSGLPKGFRHELASLEISDVTNTLTRYLIASHHGYGRPWFPACEDPDSLGAMYTYMEKGLMESFVDMLKEYGPWGLTGMELILRAADARQSIAEQEINNV